MLVQLFSKFASRSFWVAHVNTIFAKSCILMIWEFWLRPLIAATVCFNTKLLNTVNTPVAATNDSVHQTPMLTSLYGKNFRPIIQILIFLQFFKDGSILHVFLMALVTKLHQQAPADAALSRKPVWNVTRGGHSYYLSFFFLYEPTDKHAFEQFDWFSRIGSYKLIHFLPQKKKFNWRKFKKMYCCSLFVKSHPVSKYKIFEFF